MAVYPEDRGLASGSGSAGEQAGQPYPGTTQQPGELVQQTAQRAQAASGQLADQAKQQISAQLQTQKERATGSMGNIAQALRQTSQQLQDQGQAPIADYAAKAAEGVERVTNYLSEREIADLRAEAERLARTQPVMFLAGAFALGWLAARFFKSSTPAQSSNQGNTAYQGQPSYPNPPYGSRQTAQSTYDETQSRSPRPATSSAYPEPSTSAATSWQSSTL